MRFFPDLVFGGLGHLQMLTKQNLHWTTPTAKTQGSFVMEREISIGFNLACQRRLEME